MDKQQPKSTVSKLRTNTSWGNIMYSACYAFNQHFSDYWLEYCLRFDDGLVFASLPEEKRNAENELNLLKQAKKQNASILSESVQRTIEAYKQYNSSKVLGNVVRSYRSNPENCPEYANLLQARQEAYQKYNLAMQERKQAESGQARYNALHSYDSKRIANRITAINRKMLISNLPMTHSICDDYEILNNLILSEEQTEKLMGLLLSILAINTNNAFIIQLTDLQRERICDALFEHLNGFKHIYDFATGCYEEVNGTLVMKSPEVLAKTLYNGYYLTLKGYCLRAFMQVVKESECVLSIYDLYPPQNNNNNANCEFDALSFNTERATPLGGPSQVVDLWREVSNCLQQEREEIAIEVREKMQRMLPKGNYYETERSQNDCRNAIQGTIDGITFELSEGRNVPARIKNIVLDAIGGVESAGELDSLVHVITDEFKSRIAEYLQNEN